MIPCKLDTVPSYGHSMEKHARILSHYDNVFYAGEQKFDLQYSRKILH